EGKAHLVTLAAPLIDRIPGNHLRALMRQRLSEITGLSGEMLQQVAQSSPPERTTSLESVPPHEHYPDTPHDYADIADYAHHIEPPAEAYAPQKFWKKNSEWRQGGERKKTPPRKPVHVEAPTLTALRTLLHHPQLAQKVEDVSHFADEEDTYAQLLV